MRTLTAVIVAVLLTGCAAIPPPEQWSTAEGVAATDRAECASRAATGPGAIPPSWCHDLEETASQKATHEWYDKGVAKCAKSWLPVAFGVLGSAVCMALPAD